MWNCEEQASAREGEKEETEFLFTNLKFYALKLHNGSELICSAHRALVFDYPTARPRSERERD